MVRLVQMENLFVSRLRTSQAVAEQQSGAVIVVSTVIMSQASSLVSSQSSFRRT